jgi:hypothetical protein
MADPQSQAIVPGGTLRVLGRDLTQTARQVRVLGKGALKQDVWFMFVDGKLLIDAGGAKFWVPAAGCWSARIIVPVQFILKLATARFFPDEIIEVTSDGATLSIGSLCTECDWSRLPCPRIELPIDARLIELLALSNVLSHSDIEHSGLTDAIAIARQKAASLVCGAQCLIDQASRILRPIGTFEWRLQGLIEAAVDRRAQELLSALKQTADCDGRVDNKVSHLMSMLSGELPVTNDRS